MSHSPEPINSKALGPLLYATDRAPYPDVLDDILSGLDKIGVKEVICLQPTALPNPSKRISKYGMSITLTPVDKISASIIADTAQQKGAFLTVVNFGQTSAQAIFYRQHKTIERLINSSQAPMIFLPPDLPRTRGQNIFQRVVFATCWSKESAKAFSFLMTCKAAIQELEIVHVIDQKLTVGELRQLKQRLKDTRAKLVEQGIDAESHVYAGKQAEEIVLASQDYDATCIVLGKGNKTSAWKSLWKKSPCLEIIQTSCVPTMVVV